MQDKRMDKIIQALPQFFELSIQGYSVWLICLLLPVPHEPFDFAEDRLVEGRQQSILEKEAKAKVRATQDLSQINQDKIVDWRGVSDDDHVAGTGLMSSDLGLHLYGFGQ